MPPLDAGGRRLLEHYRLREGHVALQDVPDAAGSDDEGRIGLVMDAARRVREVRVADTRGLTTPAGLSAAVGQAFATADAARGVASLERSGALDEWIEQAAGYAHRTRRIDPGSPPGVSREAALRRGTSRRSARSPHPRGSSANGYLEIVLDPRGDLLEVTADELWLSAVRTEHLARALTEAFDDTRQGE